MQITKNSFEDFDSEDFGAYKKRLLLRELQVILEEAGELTPADVPIAYERFNSLIQQDLDFLANKWCLYLNSGHPRVDPSKCCFMQLKEGKDLHRDAVILVHRMRPFLLSLVYKQPEDKRGKILDYLRVIFQMRYQVEIRSDNISTFAGLFEGLSNAVNAIDEVYGKYYKMKPHFDSLLRELGPGIVLKIKKYSDHPRLGYDKCKFCNSRWVQENKEPDIKNLNNLACFKNPQELEKFWALSFRQMFYAELLKLINDNLNYHDTNFEF